MAGYQGFSPGVDNELGRENEKGTSRKITTLGACLIGWVIMPFNEKGEAKKNEVSRDGLYHGCLLKLL